MVSHLAVGLTDPPGRYKADGLPSPPLIRITIRTLGMSQKCDQNEFFNNRGHAVVTVMTVFVLGMSTAAEVIVARQCNMRCFSLALVTNVCVTDDDDTSKDSSTHDATASRGPSHDEVLTAGLQQTKNIRHFFCGLIAEIGKMLRTYDH